MKPIQVVVKRGKFVPFYKGDGIRLQDLKNREGKRFVIEDHNIAGLKLHNLLHAYIHYVAEGTNQTVESAKRNISLVGEKQNDPEKMHGSRKIIDVPYEGKTLNAIVWERGSYSYKNNTNKTMQKLIEIAQLYALEHDLLDIESWSLHKQHNINRNNFKRYLIGGLQDWECPISGQVLHGGLEGIDAHHVIHNTLTNKKKYPVFLQSILNLYLVYHDSHMKEGHWKPAPMRKIGDKILKQVEESLSGYASPFTDQEREYFVSPTLEMTEKGVLASIRKKVSEQTERSKNDMTIWSTVYKARFKNKQILIPLLET